MNTQTNTEQNILKAAEQLFMEKGFSSTSTTEIAEMAGCNQALVHYYFRTKENLFQRIFTEKFSFLVDAFTIKDDDGDFFSRLKYRIGKYFDIEDSNRQIPFMVINELLLNKDRRDSIKKHFESDPKLQGFFVSFGKEVQDAVKAGMIRQIDSVTLIFDIISLVAFTFLMVPIYEDWTDERPVDTGGYIAGRREECIQLIISGISSSRPEGLSRKAGE